MTPDTMTADEERGESRYNWANGIESGSGALTPSRVAPKGLVSMRPQDTSNHNFITTDAGVIVPLSRGKGTLIDTADLELVTSKKWSATFTGSHWYALARVEGKVQYLHRWLTSPEATQVVDHINGDTLDNRRSNLRICTHAENCRNHATLHNRNSTGYHGVSVESGKFQARIMLDGKSIHIGAFTTIEEAIAARDAAALELHGEFARLNGKVA